MQSSFFYQGRSTKIFLEERKRKVAIELVPAVELLEDEPLARA